MSPHPGPIIREDTRPASALRLAWTILAFAFWTSTPARATMPEGSGASTSWLGAWASAQQLTEERNLPPGRTFDDHTLRQTIRATAGGETVRLRLSNEFGDAPLEIGAVNAAQAEASGAPTIDPETRVAVTFGGRPDVTIPAGTARYSDPFTLAVIPGRDIAITMHLHRAPTDVTGHPGSRTTSYLMPGNHSGAPTLADATPVDHWYFVAGMEVQTTTTPKAVAIIGDSLTDGRGSTTNGNDRWPDQLARRLQTSKGARPLAVLNLGIGGNRLLADGLGPSVLARMDRDVLSRGDVRWLILLIGINDIGTADVSETAAALANRIIAGLGEITTRAHWRDIKVYGGTIIPMGESFYYSERNENARSRVNDWIRNRAPFDAVIDFDAAVRASDAPSRLRADADSGDHLHLNPHGYRLLAEAIDLQLFTGD